MIIEGSDKYMLKFIHKFPKCPGFHTLSFVGGLRLLDKLNVLAKVFQGIYIDGISWKVFCIALYTNVFHLIAPVLGWFNVRPAKIREPLPIRDPSP